ncbi:MAG TPA: hypothetical protein VE968_06770, partial [Sphingomicrobium sp.]|nr:hypothetical protein [Sphingomicrobium sp.]
FNSPQPVTAASMVDIIDTSASRRVARNVAQRASAAITQQFETHSIALTNSRDVLVSAEQAALRHRA